MDTSDTAPSSAPSPAELRRDARTSRAWLHFPERPADDVIAALKAAGWRWSGYRKQWHNPRRLVLPPACVAYVDAGACDFSDERAERLEARAEKTGAAAQAAYAAARAVVERIPFGQPVLLGHHSQKRHQRDLARHDAGMSKAFALGDEARGLQAAAESSRRHQESQDSAPGIARRLERARAELRKVERIHAEGGYASHPGLGERLLADVRARIARDEAALAALGPQPWDTAKVKAGDVVRINGHVVRVARVSAKSYSGEIIEGGAKGMRGRWARSDFQGFVRRAGEEAAP